MAVLTGDMIIDRVRSLCVSSPFYFTEATGVFDFDLTPSPTLTDRPVFFIEPLQSRAAMGYSGYRQDRIDDLVVSVAYNIDAGDYNQTRNIIAKDVHSLTAAITRDGHVTSGDYGILDEGADSVVSADRGAQFMVLRLTLPVQYEVSL